VVTSTAAGAHTRLACIDRTVCPWHASKYDVRTGRMVRGPQGAFAKIPGLGSAFKALTHILPLARGTVTKRGGDLVVD